jgi:hypothetical protein
VSQSKPPKIHIAAVNAIIDKLLDVRGARPGKQVNLVSGRCLKTKRCHNSEVQVQLLSLESQPDDA